MIAPLVFYGNVEPDGKIGLPKSARQQIGQAFAGKRVEVTVKRARKSRSTQQNRYYWGVVIPLIIQGINDANGEMIFSAASPDDVQQVHSYLKSLFIPAREVADARGEAMQLPPSTKSLTTTEMMEYTEQVRRWAGEFLFITIPEPGEQIEMF